MGILNTTPDSFFEGSRFSGKDGILQQVEKMVVEGAAIIDIGGQSTRPGSERISAEEEMRRVITAIESIHFNFPDLVISVDTYYAKVAEAAVMAGAGLVNDVSAGEMDPLMIATVADLGVPYVCTHMKGRPENMQENPRYDNVTKEVLDFFIQRSSICRRAGINDVILDPGIGFGKSISHNFQLIKELDLFRILEMPLLLGVSRKGTVYKTLGITATEALNGTTVLNTIALLKGAAILRVHDVKEAVEAIKLVEKISAA
jgi:dihydropteroate synthase